MSQKIRFVIFLIFIAVISTISALATAYFVFNKAKFGEYTFLLPPFLNMIVGFIGALFFFYKKPNKK